MLESGSFGAVAAVLLAMLTWQLGGCGVASAAERGQSGGPLRVLSAYYMPDPKPPANSHAVEGEAKPRVCGVIFEPLQRLYKEHADFGGARVVVQNASDSDVQIDKVKLNGKVIEEQYVDFLDGAWDDRGVVWYRVRPRSLSPGQCGEIYIRFRRRPAGDVARISIELNGGESVDAEFSYEDPGVSVDYVTTDASQRRLYIYARRGTASVGQLKSVMLDGRLLKNAKIYGSDFPGNVALAVAELPEPLKVGEFHVVSVATDSGRSVAAQFRVLDFFFMRAGWRWSPESVEEVEEVRMNFVEHAWPLEKAKKFGVYTGGGGHERHRLEYMADEPDAHDRHPEFEKKYGKMVADKGLLYSGLPYAVALGMNARKMAAEGADGMIPAVERKHPHVATHIITNGTTRPLNWFVYGQLTDVNSTDPYGANIYGADFATVREQFTLVRQAAAPRRVYICLEAYEHGASAAGIQRQPTGAEFRQSAVQGLGCGAKGIHSWLWPKIGGWIGANVTPDVRAEYIRINKLTEHIETELLLGAPVDIVTNDSGLTETGSHWALEPGKYKLDKPWMKERVWTGAVLCGPDAIVIAAANHIPASKPKPKKIEPARNVNVTVALPDFLKKVDCFEVDGKGVTPHPCRVEGGKAIITIDAIKSGRVFLLRRK